MRKFTKIKLKCGFIVIRVAKIFVDFFIEQMYENKSEQAHIPHAPTLPDNAIYVYYINISFSILLTSQFRQY